MIAGNTWLSEASGSSQMQTTAGANLPRTRSGRKYALKELAIQTRHLDLFAPEVWVKQTTLCTGLYLGSKLDMSRVIWKKQQLCSVKCSQTSQPTDSIHVARTSNGAQIKCGVLRFTNPKTFRDPTFPIVVGNYSDLGKELCEIPFALHRISCRLAGGI